jgi:hypothetical protein
MSGSGILLALTVWTTTAQPLPVVEDVNWPQLRRQTERLLQALEELGFPLPDQDRKTLAKVLAEAQPKDTGAAAAEVQKVLDPFCLVGVNINPESRVKVARGPAPAELRLKQNTLLLIKVHNDAGVTHSLAISGTQLRAKEKAEEGRWLTAAVVAPARLSGQKLEYALLRLRPHEAGKREATLRFDVGQGTQDLGFRAETPILFTVQR